MFLFKRILATVLIILTVLSTTCCGSGEGVLVSYSLLRDPQNLDPQTADDSGAIMIINNTFEGLYKRKTDGSCELGGSSSVEYENGGLILRFKIKDNLYWKYYTTDNKLKDNTEFNEKVTARDYVFGFKRLFSPQNNTPFASDYFFIKNAQQVKSGKMTADNLGVVAEDDYTLKIELNHTNPMMQELFADAPAMPCNEEFFLKTKGRYGMSGSMLISNGPFYVDSWSTTKDSKYVRIRKNAKYYDKDNVLPSGVNLTVRSQGEAYEAFSKKKIDTAVVTQTQMEGLNLPEKQAQPFKGSVMGIGFNQDHDVFSNENIRKGLANDINRASLKEKLIKNDEMANTLIPPAVTIGQDSYRSAATSKLTFDYNSQQASKLFNQGMAELNKVGKKVRDLNSLSVLVCQSSNSFIESVMQTWQKDLNVFFKLDIQNENDYNKKLESGDFDCVVMSVSSDADSPDSVLNKFNQSSPYNFLNCNIKSLDNDLDNAAQQPDFSSMVNNYLAVESKIIDTASFIPISYVTEYFVSKKGIEGLQFNPGSRQIYFPFIRKK